jgi:hypothetical protein
MTVCNTFAKRAHRFPLFLALMVHMQLYSGYMRALDAGYSRYSSQGKEGTVRRAKKVLFAEHISDSVQGIEETVRRAYARSVH